jgi:hypothetical protein
MVLKVERVWGTRTTVLHADVCTNAAMITSGTRILAFIVNGSRVKFTALVLLAKCRLNRPSDGERAKNIGAYVS